jgi:hypothetical protein
VAADLDMCNPYVPQLRRFNSVPSGALELSDISCNGDFAAIMHGSNTTTIEPRNIVMWKNHESAPTFVPIFSRHYEPLQYPFFSHMATPGWGLTEDPSGHFNQYTHLDSAPVGINTLLLREDRFLTFGRLGLRIPL